MHKYIQLAKKIVILLVVLTVVAVAGFRVLRIYQAQAADQFCVAKIVVRTNVPTTMEFDGQSENVALTEHATIVTQTNNNATTHQVKVQEYQDNQVGKTFESSFEVKDFKCFASSSDWSLDPVPTTTLEINLDTQKMTVNGVTPAAAPVAPAPAAPAAPAAPVAQAAGPSTYSNPVCTGTNEESPIRQALLTKECDAVGCWAITSWKVVLALANLGLVVILIFIAIVNILRIQYDTYAIKKALPVLIIGIILANFSLLIVRMFVDFANILTNLFTHGCTPGEFAANMITATDVGGPKAAEAFAGTGGMGIGTLLIWFLFALFVMVAFLILGFLFYIRYAVVIILAIVAPLAFVAMAFPPTQGFFKQWWGWLMKFIFMKPISFFLLYLAGKILEAGTGSQSGMTHLTLWFIVAFLVYLALIIPFKLGGAVMGAWGGVGKWATGTGKGGWARKPVEEWWGRRKDQAGAYARMRLPWLFAGAEKDRQITEQMKKTAEDVVKQRARRNPAIVAWEKKAKKAGDDLKSLTEKQGEMYESGKLKLGWWLRLTSGEVKWEGKGLLKRPRLKGKEELAKESIDSAAWLVMNTKIAQAHTQDATNLAIARIGRESNELTEQFRGLKDKGISLPLTQVDIKGRLQKVYQIDKETGEFKKDENGNPIEELGDVDATWEMVSQLRLRSIVVGKDNPELARNLAESADQLEKQVMDFTKAHPTDVRGRPINYSAFLDKKDSGRVLSATTSWALEDIQTNLLNENPQSRLKRSLNSFGNRNMRSTKTSLDRFVGGQRQDMDIVEAIQNGVFTQEWVQAMERGGKKNRALDFRNFLLRFDGGGIIGDPGELLGRLLQREQQLTPGIIGGFLAEQMINTSRRGQRIEGLGEYNIQQVPRDKAKALEFINHQLANQELSAEDYVKLHPEIFARVDFVSRGAMTMDTRALFDGMTDSISEMKIFCGGGNPISQMIRAKDISPEERLADLDVPDPSADPHTFDAYRKQVSERRERKERERQALETADQQLRNSTPETLQSDIASRGARRVLNEKGAAINNIETAAQQIASAISAGGQPVSLEGFRQEIAQAITGATATSLEGLQEELRTRLNIPDLTISPDIGLDTEELVANFKIQVGSLQVGLNNADLVQDTARAEDVLDYTPRRADTNESDESIRANLNRLTEAVDEFNRASENLRAANQSPDKMPSSVNEKLIDAISTRGAVVPLTRQILATNPAKLNEMATKMLVGLRALLRTPAADRMNDQAILRSIRNELNELDETLAGQPSPAQPTPPPPAPPEPAAPTPPTPEEQVPPDTGATEEQPPEPGT